MEYHKIDTIYARDQRGRIIETQYSRPEFAYLADLEWVFTEKVDGTNIRLSYDGTPRYLTATHEYIAGRSDNAQIPPHLLTTLIELMRGFRLDVVFETDSMDVTLYGEGYGAKIQKGGEKYIPDGCSFVLFDVKVGSWWLTREAVLDVGTALGIDVVPVVGTGTLADAVKLARAGFPSARWLGVELAEGLVLRPPVELFDRGGRRIIAKIKNRDFRGLRHGVSAATS
ncbi:MAG: RNA ligase family protein [Candidatus Dormibacteria bacterium]